MSRTRPGPRPAQRGGRSHVIAPCKSACGRRGHCLRPEVRRGSANPPATRSRAMIRRMLALCFLLAFAFAAATAARAAGSFIDRGDERPVRPLRRSRRAGLGRDRADGDRGFRRLGARQADRASGRRSPEQGRRRPRDRAAMVRRAWRDGDLRHHQFGRGAGDPGSRQGARPDCHLRLGLIVRPHRQGVLAERRPVERRQLVERGRADAPPRSSRSSTASSSSPPTTPSAPRSRRTRATPSPRPAEPSSARCARRSTPPISALF